MELVDFTTYLIKNLVKNPELVKVSSFEGDEESIILQVLVCEDDMGSVIGKNGKNAKALRTLILAYAYLHGNQKVNINIDSF